MPERHAKVARKARERHPLVLQFSGAILAQLGTESHEIIFLTLPNLLATITRQLLALLSPHRNHIQHTQNPNPLKIA